MKLNIHQRVLLLVLSAGILSFFVLSGIAFYGMSAIKRDVSEMGTELGESGVTYTQDLITNQLKQTLGALASSRAEYINHEMERLMQDVIILSETMTEIASNPQNHSPRKLIDPRNEKVPMGETYITYSPDLHANGISEEIQREVAIESNISDYLVPLAHSYFNYKSSFYVGSRYGFFICSSVFPHQEFSPVEPDEISNYDPRQRPWYKKAMDAGKPVFSELYTNITDDGYQLVGCSAPYYDANGIAGVVGLDVSNTDIYDAIDKTNIGEEGFSFVLDENGKIIFSSIKEGYFSTRENSGDLRYSSSTSLADTAKSMVNGESGISLIKIDDKDFYIAYAPMPSVGWSFATLTREETLLNYEEKSREYFAGQVEKFQESLSNEYRFLFSIAVVLLAALLGVLFFLSNKFSGKFVKPIQQLSDNVREIASGNLDKKITDVHTGDEIEHLAVCFNAMTDELKVYMDNLQKVTADKERIATELNVAKDIQQGMLPSIFPPYPERKEFDVYATMDAARKVGGDFYDFYLLDENHLIVTIADVSGKGIPASLFMVISKTILKNFAVFMNNPDDFAAVMSCANNQLCQGNEEMMFVTVFLGMLDLKTGKFIYVNGGHNPPIIYHRAENRCEYLNVKKNFVLGGMEDMHFVQQEIQLEKGDLIFMYTDGVNEAMNKDNEEYTSERLLEFMNKTDCKVELSELLKAVKNDVQSHVDGAEQSDDMTMMALRRN
ncbi:MAG: SpoIIE family protein phosphatase [Selenomonadaceae bacterium]|nr:SpoIIE family protein phosphatase [Selenomonadaceae bacterium]